MLPTNVLLFNFFMWSKVVILVEETKMTISDTVSRPGHLLARLKGAETGHMREITLSTSTT